MKKLRNFYMLIFVIIFIVLIFNDFPIDKKINMGIFATILYGTMLSVLQISIYRENKK